MNTIKFKLFYFIVGLIKSLSTNGEWGSTPQTDYVISKIGPFTISVDEAFVMYNDQFSVDWGTKNLFSGVAMEHPLDMDKPLIIQFFLL